jgi:hypothetical protein
MTITVLVGQALREGFATKQEIEGFVERLRFGEAAFIDEREEGRSRSLGASLAYGFENAFSEEEPGKLALLHLFQGFVHVDTLCIMGAPEVPWSLPQIRSLTRTECNDLLGRAAEVGLLTARGDQCYSIHPALPWFFKSHFEALYREEKRLAAVRAFVESVGGLANHYHNLYKDGNTDIINILRAEEANLLHACQLTRDHDWWDPLLNVLQGLRQLYVHTGRRTEWRRLVEDILPSFVNPVDGSPLPGREKAWTFVTVYRVGLAREERRLEEAEQLQNRSVAWLRQRAAPFLDRPVAELEEERNVIQELGMSLNLLGSIRLEMGQADCVAAYEEALELAERIGNRADAAISSFSLGQAFLRLPVLDDLDQAEHWHQKSLNLRLESDTLGRGTNLAELGNIALTRFQQALAADLPEEEWLAHLDRAAQLYQDALDCLPPDAASELAVIHHQLGMVYQGQLDIDRSLFHSRQAIQEHERAGNPYAAAQSRLNTATTLLIADRREDALEYAMAALRGFESYGERAAEETERTHHLITQIRNG